MQTFAERVKEARLTWGWTQTQMAFIIGCDQATISLWEAGRVTPTGTAMFALASIMDTTVYALETGKGYELSSWPFASKALLSALKAYERLNPGREKKALNAESS